jgi:L-2-hydroxyglutarate oxidase LhgO
MGDCARFGPDVEWITKIDYAFDESRKSAFVKSIRRFFPDLDEAKLAPAYTGIRKPVRDRVAGADGVSCHW